MESEDQEKDIWDKKQDALGRKEVARYLTRYMTKRYEAKPTENGFVLAIDADWGFGKTFLLQNWCEELVKTGHVAIYFDAWKNDFTPEPLIAFIAELNSALEPQFKKIPTATRLLKMAKGNIARLWKPIALVAIGAGVKVTTGVGLETIKNALSDDSNADISGDGANSQTKASLQKGLEKIFDETLKQHKSKRESIESFRKSMSTLIEALDKSPVQLPLFVFIDELDRCRPDYAIELLEGIKHLFGIPGIYFVVATNIDQLGESTKAIYGPNFNGRRYLKRFFDMEYSLPKVDGVNFAKNLFQKITPPTRIVTGLERISLSPEENSLPNIFHKYASYFDRGLRDQEQIIRIVEAAFLTINNFPVHIHYLFFLAMLYHKSPSVFEVVVRDKHLGEKTGYRELENDVTKGIFECKKLAPNSYERQYSIEKHRVEGIASMYLQAAEINLVDLSREDINLYDFPNNIKNSLQSEFNGQYHSNTHYPSSIKRYPEIVRQAGGFAKQDE